MGALGLVPRRVLSILDGLDTFPRRFGGWWSIAILSLPRDWAIVLGA